MSKLEEQLRNTYLYASNAPFIEELHEQFLEEPDRVPQTWRAFFEDLHKDNGDVTLEHRHADIIGRLRENARQRVTYAAGGTPSSLYSETAMAAKQAAVLRLIHSYRLLGHLVADLDPIDLRETPPVPDLDLEFQGLSESDLEMQFNTSSLRGLSLGSLRDVVDVLKQTYTGHIGVEYMFLRNREQKQWIMDRLEGSRSQPRFTSPEKKDILRQLTAAEGLERYLHTKYAGQKRFSLEGGESLVPLLDTVIRESGKRQVKEVVLGMAHRGRLNVLVNMMGKRPMDLFKDFEGQEGDDEGEHERGDVKYHQGFSADIELPTGEMHLALAYNPSHLEAINPVVEGSVRARQDRRGDARRNQVLPVLIHGDAAMAGQGVVYETFNLSQTRGFSTGGTIHVVVNNQIGFTTSHPLDARSMLYCTDIGKVVQAPIFHVNGDDPEAVAYVARLALEFRMTFKRDVLIDMVCYRRHGHNEADEPAATQPSMYEKISTHDSVRALYAQQLEKAGVLKEEEADRLVKDYRKELEEKDAVSLYTPAQKEARYFADWSPYLHRKWTEHAHTGVPAAEIKRLGPEITRVPDDFELHPRVARVVEDRRKMAAGALPMDWGCAEMLAYATLLHHGYGVRLTGQDTGRGTFFHRHSVLHNQRTGESVIPLAHLYPGQPRFMVVDSILSENAVMGFEYGYSTTDPKTLVIWEAQFGDFANGAQVVIDQFISSSEVKWGRLSGLALWLPHGWEGQGPEHSSARLERFLQLCANENIQVCVPTTPAQLFHMLRREMLRPYRKPLVFMGPKSLLRRKLSFSTLEDLAGPSFKLVIKDPDHPDPETVERIVLCCGKVFYDLLEARRESGDERVALVRVEQLYPFPLDALTRELRRYPNAREVIWTQEEPMNQGAWYSIQHNIRRCLLPRHSLHYAGRLHGASPAGGSHKRHLIRQNRLVQAALNLNWDEDPVPIRVFEPKA